MEEQMLKPGDRDYVGALAAGLEVLQAFDAEHPRMTLSEVAARTGMDRAKARRFLLTLHALGFVKRAGRQFELTPRVLQLGYAYQASNQYRAVIQQYLEDITAELGESSSLAVLDGDEVVYVVRSAARHRLMAITLSVGTRLSAAYTSMGRVLLGQLPEAELDAFLDRGAAVGADAVVHHRAGCAAGRHPQGAGRGLFGGRPGTGSGAALGGGAGLCRQWRAARCHQRQHQRRPGEHGDTDAGLSAATAVGGRPHPDDCPLIRGSARSSDSVPVRPGWCWPGA